MHQDVRSGDWTIVYDDVTGHLVMIQRDGVGSAFRQEAPMLSFRIGGISTHNDQSQMSNIVGVDRIGLAHRLLCAEVSKDGAFTLITAFDRVWRLTQTFTFEGDWISMRADLAYHGEERKRLRCAEWTISCAQGDALADCELYAPGYTLTPNEPHDLHRRIADYQSEELLGHGLFGDVAPAYRAGILGAHDPVRETTVCTWWADETLPCYTPSLTHHDALTRHALVQMPRWMQAGDHQAFGTFFFGALRGTRLETLKRIMASFQPYRWDKDTDARGLRDLRIMEIHIGDKNRRVVFTEYDQIIAALPGIRELGFNAVEMMPAMPFPSYSVHDMMDVDATYQDGEGLGRMIERAHALGMRVIMDMVFHGPHDPPAGTTDLPRSPYLDAHEDWFARHETGNYARTYTRAFDLACPAYQRHIADVMLYYLDTLHPDGFRLDAQMWNEFPNWDEHTGRMPYESIYAGIRMMDGIRARVHAKYPETFFYTEANGPFVGRGHEYRYNYDFHWAYTRLCPVLDPRGTCVHTLNYACENTMCWGDYAQWLEEVQATVPRGLSVVHQVDSHDSCEWGGYIGGQFNRQTFGDGVHPVLFGMAAFSDGALMSYYGAQEGHEGIYQKLLRMRELPVFRAGNCRYTALSSDDAKTVSILWEDGHATAAFIGNLENREKTVSFMLHLPEARLRGIDGIGGRALEEMTLEKGENSFTLKLAPYQILLICG